MPELTFAEASEADIPGIQRAAEASWRATYAGIFTPDFITDFLARAYATDRLRDAIRNLRAGGLHWGFLVAKEGSQIVGFCHFGNRGPGIELYRLYVVPERWRQGVGGRLLAMMEARLAAAGVAEYFCYVHSDNRIGQAFYYKWGFVHDAARDQHGSHCEWFMVRRLRAAGPPPG
ncbi:MAG: GNAT family N-acetyltransferase [Anaerolineae bacterium]|nr:GNAT family N-acetyltransferase [Anaerolineae bacterium]